MSQSKLYKVERLMAATKVWYEVMLSPFNSLADVHAYIDKYKQYYPVNEQKYKISHTDTSEIYIEYR